MAAEVESIRSSGTKIEQDIHAIDEYAKELDQMGRKTQTVSEAIDTAREIRIGHSALFYIAGPLTGMSEATKQRYVEVSTLMDKRNAAGNSMFGYVPHLHGTDPVRHPDVTPAEVRDIDYLFAAIAPDAHINFLDPMGHGNAIEEGWAEMASIPSLYVVQKDVHLSRLVRGMHNILDTIIYDDFKRDGLPQIDAFLEQV